MNNQSTIFYALGAMLLMLQTGTSSAQGLFAKAANQAKEGLAAYEAIWDSFYGKFDELLVAEAVKDGGQLEFDADKGITHFPVRLKVNEEAYEKWKTESTTLLDAAGIQRGRSDYKTTKKIAGVNYDFPDNVISEINKACSAGELMIPPSGVLVELVDENGSTIQHAALPIGVFTFSSYSDTALPLWGLNRGKDYEEYGTMTRQEVDDAMCSVSFAGLTKDSLLSVADIRCRVLVGADFTKECNRLALSKIQSDNALFAKHGIQTKTVMLPGDVPLAVNKTPRGQWFTRYEITQGQWAAVMGGEDPSFLQRLVRSFDEKTMSNPENLAKTFGRSDAIKVYSPDMPVDMISWSDCLAFVKKLNELPAVKESGLVFSIPKGMFFHGAHRHEPDSHWHRGTPDWEYACIGGKAHGAVEMEKQGAKYGYDLEGNLLDLEEVAWTEDGGDRNNKHIQFARAYEHFIHPVGMKRPNAFGLYDMIGNVAEIVQSVDDPGGDGIAKVPANGDSGESFDYTFSKRYYTENDPHNEGWGLRLCAYAAESLEKEKPRKQSDKPRDNSKSKVKPAGGNSIMLDVIEVAMKGFGSNVELPDLLKQYTKGRFPISVTLNIGGASKKTVRCNDVEQLTTSIFSYLQENEEVFRNAFNKKLGEIGDLDDKEDD